MCFWYLRRCATESRGWRILLITFSSFDKRIGLCCRLKKSFYIPCKKKEEEHVTVLLYFPFKVTWINLSSIRLTSVNEISRDVTSFIRCYRREISYSPFFNIHAKEKLKNLFVGNIVYFSRYPMTLSYAWFAFETTGVLFFEKTQRAKDGFRINFLYE